WKPSAGQASFTPSQLSATSHGPALARHSAVLFASAGQAASVPVQVSAGSQTPAEARHSTVAGWKPSVGQSSFTPSQLSATSQGPALHASPSSAQAVPLAAGVPLHCPA